jgi:hypothetical protein
VQSTAVSTQQLSKGETAMYREPGRLVRDRIVDREVKKLELRLATLQQRYTPDRPDGRRPRYGGPT